MLLIDEIDRADEEFEAYLLELLADWQVSMPELGTIAATSIPWVVLTSNGTRELSDALRRRCLYHYVDYPDEAKETRILTTRLPGIEAALAAQIARFVQAVRQRGPEKEAGRRRDPGLGGGPGRAGRPRPARRSRDDAADACCACSRPARTRARLPRERVERLLAKVA